MMKYKLEQWQEQSGQWPEYIKLLNNNKIERERFEKKIPLLNFDEEQCHCVPLSPSGRVRRLRISDRSGLISIRVSVRTVYYLRYYKKLRFVNGAPKCGNIACANPLHQNVASWAGHEDPVPTGDVVKNWAWEAIKQAKEEGMEVVAFPNSKFDALLEVLPEYVMRGK